MQLRSIFDRRQTILKPHAFQCVAPALQGNRYARPASPKGKPAAAAERVVKAGTAHHHQSAGGALRDAHVNVSWMFRFAALTIVVCATLLYFVKPQAQADAANPARA